MKRTLILEIDDIETRPCGNNFAIVPPIVADNLWIILDQDAADELVRDIIAWQQDKGITEEPLPEPKEPEPLPQFYTDTDRVPGTIGLPEHVVYLRGYGGIWRFENESAAQTLCGRLNKAWDLDLDKQGTNEDQHDDNTPTTSRTDRPTCCTDGGTCNRSV